MTPEALRALQAPLKHRYRDNPEDALVTLKAEGHIGAGLTCAVSTGTASSKQAFTLPQEETASQPALETCYWKR